MSPLSSSFSWINLSPKKIIKIKVFRVFRIFLGSLERFIVSHMATPTTGLSSLVWEVVANVIPFRNTLIRLDNKCDFV